MTDTTPRAAEQAGDVYVDALMEARPDAALARALPSAVGVGYRSPAKVYRSGKEAGLRSALSAIDGFEPDHSVNTATARRIGEAMRASVQARLDALTEGGEDDSALASGAQAGAAGDRPGAAPAGGLPGVEETAEPGEWLFGARDVLAAFHRSASYPNARMHEIDDAVLKLAALGCPPNHRLSAAGTGDAGQEVAPTDPAPRPEAAARSTAGDGWRHHRTPAQLYRRAKEDGFRAAIGIVEGDQTQRDAKGTPNKRLLTLIADRLRARADALAAIEDSPTPHQEQTP